MDEDLSGGQSPIPLNFSTVAIGIVVIVMIWGAIRGVVKLAFTLIALACAAVVAYMAYMKLPEFSSQLETPFAPTTLVYASVGIGVATYVFTRIVIGKLLNPLALVNGKPRGGGPVGALFGLIPAAALIWVIVTAVRVTGVAQSFEHTRKEAQSGDGTDATQAPWLARLRSMMEGDAIAGWMAKLDPFVKKSKESLAKLLISAQESSTARQLATDGDAAALLSDPKVRQLLADPEIQKLLQRGEFLTLVENPKLRDAAQAPELRESLETIEVDKELRDAKRRRHDSYPHR